jgi:hypothetical protein
MYKICIINKNTRECVDVQYIENDTDWTDTDELIRCESNEGEIGDFWNGNGWLSYEEWCEKQRGRRNKYIAIHIDTINAIRWEGMSQQEKDDWSSYRQALLDIPQQEDFPRNIVWPTKPE